MIWTEFLKSTCKPKKVQKNPTCKPIKPDHPPDHPLAKPAQPTRPPEPINGRLADGLSVNLFSTDGQRISPKPDPPDPNPPPILKPNQQLYMCSEGEEKRKAEGVHGWWGKKKKGNKKEKRNGEWNLRVW